MSEIRLEKDDVTVEEITEDCAECTGTLLDAGYIVAIDFRSAGTIDRLGPYCQVCANNLAARIRDGLPAAEPVR